MLEPVNGDVLLATVAHKRTPTAEDFPLPAKQQFNLPGVPKRDQSIVSPAKSSFTFSDDDQTHARSTPPSLETSPIAPPSSRAPPFSPTSSVEGSLRQEPSRKRSNLHMSSFQEGHFSAREKVHKDSVILAEVKTNVIIRDEFLFLNELSQHLSQRYQKPTSSIFITLDHSACLLFASSFDSAYILTITALPSQILASANKRNAALIQSFITSSLGVLPDRGVVKFIGLPDEYLATGGTTLQGQTERLERMHNEERKPPDLPLPSLPSSVPTPSAPATPLTAASAQPQPLAQHPQPPPRTSSTARRKKPPALSLVPKSQSMPGSRMPSPTITMLGGSVTGSCTTLNHQQQQQYHQIPIPKAPSVPNVADRKAERMQKGGKRKSILALFGKS